MYEKDSDNDIIEKDADTEKHDDDHDPKRPQLPGTILRVFIPEGAVINLLNFIEISSPGGICFVVRIPLLGGCTGLGTILSAIKQAGGTVEVI